MGNGIYGAGCGVQDGVAWDGRRRMEGEEWEVQDGRRGLGGAVWEMVCKVQAVGCRI